MAGTNPQYLIFPVAHGFCGLAWNSVGVTRFLLPAGTRESAERSLLRRLPDAVHGAPSAEAAGVIAAAQRYFEGEKTDFSAFRLDLSEQGALFARIYALLRRLGWGQTTTYGALAKDAGLGPEAARDVGSAMARNPVPLIIPCHRVLAAGGKIGGFSAPGGVSAKARMLELESVRFEPARPTQQSFAF